jgi:hypothetical protein
MIIPEDEEVEIQDIICALCLNPVNQRPWVQGDSVFHDIENQFNDND